MDTLYIDTVQNHGDEVKLNFMFRVPFSLLLNCWITLNHLFETSAPCSLTHFPRLKLPEDKRLLFSPRIHKNKVLMQNKWCFQYFDHFDTWCIWQQFFKDIVIMKWKINNEKCAYPIVGILWFLQKKEHFFSYSFSWNQWIPFWTIESSFYTGYNDGIQLKDHKKWKLVK